jgi:tyrosyl-tRNA synthetase
MLAFWMFRHGHHVVTLVGGGTVQVGDPTGRLTARETMSDTTQTTNINSITSQLDKMWHNMRAYSARRDQSSKEGTRELLNNASWLGNLTLMDFLRDMGRGVRIGTLLGRDT